VHLGIDLGTSSVKAVIVDGDATVVAQATAPLAVARPQPGWSEQDPDDWWTAADTAVLALDPGLRRNVRGIGLAGQMHGAVVLGGDDRPLRPAILWNDGRSAAEAATLGTTPGFTERAANLAMPGFTAPKLLWLRDHEPALFAAIRTALLPKDYLRLRMTGDKATDLSDASGTLWLDVAGRRWSDALLVAGGMAEAQLPVVVEGTAVTGVLRAEIADRWGMARVAVAAGGGDNAAGAVGVGVVADGDALLSLGTSGVIFVATDTLRPDPPRAVHAFCHCLPGLWHQMSVSLSAAACLDWAARLTGTTVAGLFAAAEATGIGTGPELFLPYLSGERTPHNDAAARGALLSLDHETDRGRIAAAVLEGVAFALADGLDALRAAGSRVAELTVIGGGARSRHWGRILAATLDSPLVYLAGAEIGPALGAARLAALAVDGGAPAEVCRRPPVAYRIDPDAALVARLASRRAAFADRYARLKGL